MERVTCAFCGLPFRVRVARPGESHFCCSGCALASRIPVTAEGLPVSRALVVALVLGFGLFNQLLFTALAAATAAEGRQAEADLFVLVAQAVGGVLTVACMAFVVTAIQRTASDWGVLVAALAGGGVALWRWMSLGPAASSWVLLATNLFLAAWLTRGWLRRAWVRRKQPAGAER